MLSPTLCWGEPHALRSSGTHTSGVVLGLGDGPCFPEGSLVSGFAPAGRHSIFVWDHMSLSHAGLRTNSRLWAAVSSGACMCVSTFQLWPGGALTTALPWGHSTLEGQGWQRVVPVCPPHPAGGLHTTCPAVLWGLPSLPRTFRPARQQGAFPTGVCTCWEVMGSVNDTVPFTLAMISLASPSMVCGGRGCGQQGKRSHSKNSMTVT